MGLGMALLFASMCGGIAIAGLFYTEAQYLRRRREKISAGSIILYLLTGGCVVFSLYMGWMLLDGLHFAGL